MNWIEKHLTFLLTAAAVLGVCLVVYPTFSDWWNSFHQSRAVATYTEAVAGMDTAEYDQLIAEAEEYNRRLAEDGTTWILTEEEEEIYNSLLDFAGNGIMSYICIPKLNLTLPVYHGIEENILQIAIGHIPGSSLPTGGTSTHCVVSGHRGLPSAKLFTDLDKLAEGDTFSLTTLHRTITYEVDQVRIVEPTDLSDIQIEEGKDYCTLVTCTPYGINTHRLLVRGHRVANPQGDADVPADAILIDPDVVAPMIAIPVAVILFIIMMILPAGGKGRNRKAYRADRYEENRRNQNDTRKQKDNRGRSSGSRLEDFLDHFEDEWSHREAMHRNKISLEDLDPEEFIDPVDADPDEFDPDEIDPEEFIDPDRPVKMGTESDETEEFRSYYDDDIEAYIEVMETRSGRGGPLK